MFGPRLNQNHWRLAFSGSFFVSKPVLLIAGLGVIGLPFTPKVFCKGTGEEGNQGQEHTHAFSHTHKRACHTWRAVKQCIFSELGSTTESDGSPQQKLSWDIWKARNDRMKIAHSAAVRGNIPFSEERKKKKKIESTAMSPEIFPSQ